MVRVQDAGAVQTHGTSAAPAARRRGTSGKLSRWDMRLSPYAYIAPFFILFGVFGLYPLLMTGWMSLHDWNLIGDKTFVGFENYSALFGDEYFWNAVGNTAIIFIIATIP